MIPFSTRPSCNTNSFKRYGINYLFRNQLFLPLGLTFNRAMTEEVFRQLPAKEKSEALLRHRRRPESK